MPGGGGLQIARISNAWLLLTVSSLEKRCQKRIVKRKPKLEPKADASHHLE